MLIVRVIMALTSASTISDAYAQWQNNLVWEGDLTKAQNALEAARYLLMCRPQMIAAETGVNMRFADLKDQIKRLEDYISATSTAVNRAQFTRGNMLLH